MSGESRRSTYVGIASQRLGLGTTVQDRREKRTEMEAACTFANRKAQTIPNDLAGGIVRQLDLRDNPQTCQQWRVDSERLGKHT